MRIATDSAEDFSNTSAKLKGVGSILKSLDFGAIVSPENYELLTDYQKDWEQFFIK